MSETKLVADDSADDSTALMPMVRALDKRAFEKLNAEEAFAQAHASKSDLILMAVVMPVSSGYEATRKINKDPSIESVPLIIVSNRNKETDKLWGLFQEATAYFFRPVAIDSPRAEIICAVS